MKQKLILILSTLLCASTLSAQEVVPSDSIEQTKTIEILLDTVLVAAPKNPQADPRLKERKTGSSGYVNIGRHLHRYTLSLREGYEASVVAVAVVRPFQRFNFEEVTTEEKVDSLTRVHVQSRIVKRTGLLDQLRDNATVYILGGKYLTQRGAHINPSIVSSYCKEINKKHVLYGMLLGGYYWHQYKAYESDAPTLRAEIRYAFRAGNGLDLGVLLPYGYHVQEGVMVSFSEYESHWSPQVWGNWYIGKFANHIDVGYTWQTDGAYRYKSPLVIASMFYDIPIPLFRKLNWQMSVGVGGVYKRDHSSGFIGVQWKFVQKKSLSSSWYYK